MLTGMHTAGNAVLRIKMPEQSGTQIQDEINGREAKLYLL
jgi:hypothetical protein